MRSRTCRFLTSVSCTWVLATACADRTPAPRLPVQPPVAVAPAPPPPPPPPSGPEQTAIEPLPPLRAASLETGELIVGQGQALVAWRADGMGHRMISSGAALFPRRYGRDHVLVLRPGESDLRLDLIALATGERRELAQLPAFRCAERAEPVNLYVHDPLDFTVDPSRGVACLGLADASANAAQVRVRMRVDLRSQRIESWLVVGELSCTPPEGVRLGDPAPDGSCWENPVVVPRPLLAADFPFTFTDESLYMPGASRGSVKSRLRGYQLEEPSPSGRWLLLAGDYFEREVVYRRLLMVDRKDGKLFPIALVPGLWPLPLTAAGGQFKTPIRQTRLAAATSDVRWLVGASGAELLVLDTCVVLPGERTFEVPEGTFAR